MVGFPGETVQDHALTRDLIQNSPLTYLHVFPFSRRPGTAAAQLEEEGAKAVAALRSLELRTLAELKNRRFRGSQVGRDLPVITLQDKSPQSTTRALSSNFLKVELAGAELQPNQLLQVRVIGLTREGVSACSSDGPAGRRIRPRDDLGHRIAIGVRQADPIAGRSQLASDLKGFAGQQDLRFSVGPVANFGVTPATPPLHPVRWP